MTRAEIRKQFGSPGIVVDPWVIDYLIDGTTVMVLFPPAIGNTIPASDDDIATSIGGSVLELDGVLAVKEGMAIQIVRELFGPPDAIWEAGDTETEEIYGSSLSILVNDGKVRRICLHSDADGDRI